MESLTDNHVLGKGENFRVPTGTTKGTGLIEKGLRKYAQFTNKIAIDIEHNISFTRFYQKTFYDSANIFSGEIAKKEGLGKAETKARAAEILKDAVRIEPQTQEGKMVRMLSQQQSARITSTNDTWLSRVALSGKNILNKTPGLPLGDLIVPIAKIPATIVSNAIENSAIGLPKATYDTFKGWQKIQSSDLKTKYEGMGQFAKGLQRLFIIAGTLAVGGWISSQLTKEDFRSDAYGAHYVKMGNTWINMEYFMAISPNLAGMMMAKEKGGVHNYISGVLASIANLPGVDELYNLTHTDWTKYASTFVSSRGVPAFIPNLLNNRPIERLFFGAHGIESQQEVTQDTKASAQKAAAKRQKNAATKPPTTRKNGGIRVSRGI